MVYQGKPSQGCGTCRKRRIKCDLDRPICGQCIKSKRKCLGYRDQVDLMFVDQTGSVEAKASGQRSKQSWSPKMSDGLISDSDVEMPVQLVPKSLTETAQRQAMAFFFSNFLVTPRYQDTTRGYLELIAPLLSHVRANSPLYDATAAAALAALATTRQSHQLRLESNQHYGNAVTTLQQAIADPRLSRSNETLLAVMVLGLFESLVASKDSILEWSHHADGALALVRYRGEEMLDHPMSRKLYWSVRTQAVYSNIIANLPLEPFLDWETVWDEPLILPDENNSVKLAAITARLPCLRAAAAIWLKRPMNGEVALKCINLMGYAKILDQLIAGWSFNLPSFWAPRVVGTVDGPLDNPETADFYSGKVEVYADLWVANIINSWRIFRGTCNMLVVNCLERLYPKDQLARVREFQEAVELIQEMADGVCASVPYHLGYSLPSFDSAVISPSLSTQSPSPAATTVNSPHSNASENTQSSHTSFDQTEAVGGMIGGHYMILPLFFTYPIHTLPDAQRRWLSGRLSYIGKTYGSGQAVALADLCPRSNEHGRPETNADFAPPPFVSFPDIYSIVTSPKFHNDEALKDFQPLTAEAQTFRVWRKDFLQRLLGL